jgi:hypothetical protein
MPDKYGQFSGMIASLATSGGFLFVILASSLPEDQKYFAITIFFLIGIVLYGEVSYQKKSVRGRR